MFACFVSQCGLFCFVLFFNVTAPPKIPQSLTRRGGVKPVKVTEVSWCPREGNTNAALFIILTDASEFPKVASNSCQRIRKPGPIISSQQTVISKRMC